jgi:hypothetical protein
MKALSIRAPWWWFILHGGKDIENRDWRTNFRGRVLIHASKWFNLGEVAEDSETAIGMMLHRTEGSAGAAITYREMRNLGGHIVGSVEIVDCIWFVGRYGLVLRDPIVFANPFPFKGALSFFEVPDQLVTEVPR